MHEIYRTWDRVRAIVETARSEDGYVTASVGADSALRSLELDPRVYRDPDAEALARSVRDTISAAVRLARSHAFDVMRPLLPSDVDRADADLEFGPLTRHLARGGR